MSIAGKSGIGLAGGFWDGAAEEEEEEEENEIGGL
jgi:hypothetical protein